MASAIAAASPTGTSRPHRPPSRISRGPLGQSVETTLAPQARASTRTLANPSHREESTSAAALAIQA